MTSKSKKVKTLLYATDYAENSVAALKYAWEFSKALKARLLVIHVFDYPTVLETEVQEPFPQLEADAYREHQRKLEAFCSSYLEDAQWNATHLEMEAIEHKNVRNAIIDRALDVGAYLVIVGMRGGSALREVLMGNTTKKLISEAPCPILSVPADAGFNGIQTIVYATDFEEEDIAVLEILADMAGALGATIQVVHIASEGEYAGLQRREWFVENLKSLDSAGVSLEVVSSENTFETLRVYLGDHNADLAVMMEREKQGFLKRVFHRDMVKRMEAYGRIPLLAFHERNFKFRPS